MSSSQLDLLFSQLGGELVEGGEGKEGLEGEDDVARKGGLEGEEDVARKGGLWHFLEEECGLEEREEVAGLLLPAAAALALNLGQVNCVVMMPYTYHHRSNLSSELVNQKQENQR